MSPKKLTQNFEVFVGRIFLSLLLSFVVVGVSAKPVEASVSTFNLLWSAGSSGSSNGQFNYPRGVAFDSSGYLYVANGGNNRIEKFTSAGAYYARYGSYGTGNGQFSFLYDIAVDASGNIYVTDNYNNRIQKLNSSFVWQWTVGGTASGTGDTQFGHPNGIGLDSSGNVYVADYDNHRISKFSSAGTFLMKFGTLGTGNGQFNNPSDVAVDSSGNIYVADTGNYRVQKFDSSGNYLSQFGTRGSYGGQLTGGLRIAIDSSNNLWITDTPNYNQTTNGRIQKFDSNGNFLAQYINAGAAAYGIAVDPSGNIFFTDSAPKLRKFDFNGTAYQLSNVSASLSVKDVFSLLSVKTPGLYGLTAAATIRLRDADELAISDVVVTLSADGDWTSVNADSDQVAGKSFVSSLIGAPGAATTHTLYVPIPNGRISTAVRICPNATSLADVTAGCTNGVSHGAGTFTEPFGTVTISQVSNLGSNVGYWKITGMTGSGGLAEGFTEFSGSGTGTSGDPYLITSCAQLQEMQNNRNAYYSLTADLDCAETETWNTGAGFVPVGAISTQPFVGTFLGNNHTISNLHITLGTSGIGLFGYTDGATVTNLTLSSLHYNITGDDNEGIGGLVGRATGGTFDNIVTSGTIEQLSSSSTYNWTGGVGGVFGNLAGTAQADNSSSSVNITILQGDEGIGGFVGVMYGTSHIEDSHATGYIHGVIRAYSNGGFVGAMVSNSTIARAYATGELHLGIDALISGGGDSYNNGGFAGSMGGWGSYLGTTSITDSYSTGNITMEGEDNYSIGGFIGTVYESATISNSHAIGTITTTQISNVQIGGFAGYMYTRYAGTQPTITNSYATGNITTSFDSYDIGGFVGKDLDGIVQDSYSEGSILVGRAGDTSTAGGDLGGFVGEFGVGSNGTSKIAQILRCHSIGSVSYYGTDASNLSTAGGFAGYMSGTSSVISKSYSTGNASGGYDTGGFAGYIGGNGATVSESYSTGSASGTYDVGGFVGYIAKPTTGQVSIANSYSRGTVHLVGNDEYAAAGGFAGEMMLSTVQNVYSTGSITMDVVSSSIGGFVGYMTEGIPGATASFWDTELSGQATSDTGVGRTTAQMKDRFGTFYTWNFEDTWLINGAINDGYPILRYQVPALAFSGSGAGTSGDPYQITTCAQLQEMYIDKDAYYTLMNDIDCSATSTWNNGFGFAPVGFNSTTPFTGSLAGNNRSITGLVINVHNSYNGIGLFAYTSGATVTDLTLSSINYHLYDTLLSEQYRGVGGLAGFADGGTFSNIHVLGVIQRTNDGMGSGNLNYLGGILGKVDGSAHLSDSVFSGGITTTSNSSYVGGAIGLITGNATIETTIFTGAIHVGYGGESAGGFVGQMEGGSITHCSALGGLSLGDSTDNSRYSYQTGGFVGQTYGVSGNPYIGQSYTTVSISYQGTADVYDVGGFIGIAQASGTIIEQSSSSGSVSGRNYIGGFAGDVYYASPTGIIIRDCYARGNAQSTANITDATVAGFVSYFTGGTITRSYSTGQVSYQNTSINGLGFISYVEEGVVVTDSYWDTETSGRATSNGGTGKTTTQMKTKATYTGWDFDTVWSYDPAYNDGYPAFAWQNEGVPLSAPTVVTNASVDNISYASATVKGTVTSDGNDPITERGVVYSSSNATPTTADSKQTTTGTTGNLSVNVTGLTVSTHYYTRAYATNSTGTSYGGVVEFTTTGYIAPVVITGTASSIGDTTATVGGEVTDAGGVAITERGIAYSTTVSLPSIQDSKKTTTGTTGTMSVDLTDLQSGTHYYARAYATNSIGTGYGSAIEFTTTQSSVSPTVTTGTASALDDTAFTMSGEVTADGGSTILQRGFVYSSTVTVPTTITGTVKSVVGSTGTMSTSITPLAPKTLYYVRAFATNGSGTSYGSVVTVTTLEPDTLRAVYYTFAKFRYNKYASPSAIRAGDTAYIKNYNTSKLKLLQVFLYDYAKKGNQGFARSKVTTYSMFLRSSYLLPTGKRYAYVMKFQDRATGIIATKYFVFYTTKTWLGKSVLGIKSTSTPTGETDLIATPSDTPTPTPTPSATPSDASYSPSYAPTNVTTSQTGVTSSNNAIIFTIIGILAAAGVGFWLIYVFTRKR